MRSFALLAVIALLAAGCSGKGRVEPTTSATAPGMTATVSAEAPRPAWEIGQGWTYAVEVPGEPTRTFRMMVAEERGDLWVVAVDDRAQAIHHAVYGLNPVMGRIGKETLAPLQGGAPVDMYQFPLTDGKSWTASFFGEEMAFRAAYTGDIDTSAVDAAHGLGRLSTGFRVTATGPTKTVRFDYVESAEWFTSFEVASGGKREAKLTLTDLLKGYKGSYFFWRGADALSQMEAHDANAAPATPTHDAVVPEDFKDRVAIGVVYLGQSGTAPPSAKVTLQAPDGSTAWEQAFGGATQDTGLADFNGAAGTWKVSLQLIGAVRVDVKVAGLQAFAEGAL